MYRVILKRLVLFIRKITLHSLNSNDGIFYLTHKYIIFHKTFLNLMTIVEFFLPLFFLISISLSCIMKIIAVPDNKHKLIPE